MKKNSKCLLITVLLVFITISSWGQIPFNKNSKGRIAMSSDGNFWDTDDYGATAASFALMAKAELQDKFVLYTYADHVWGSEANRLPDVRKSAFGGRDRFKFNKAKYVEAVTNPELAYNSMRDEINASSADNPLIIICAGPMEVVGIAMDRAQQAKRQYVTLISHSWWNDNHSDRHESSKESSHNGWTWDEMKRSFSNANFIKIKDQNQETSRNGGFNTEKAGPGGSRDWDSWNWMRDSNDENIKWVYSRAQAVGRPDISDCGMVWYLIHNDEDGGPQKMKNYLGNRIVIGGGNNGGNTGGNNGGSGNCGTAWNSNGNYAQKAIVSLNGKKWRWKPKKRGNCRPGVCKKWKDLGNCSSKSTNNTIATNNSKASLDLKVYPNPAKEVITVSGSNSGAPIIIYDLSGKMVINHISKNEKESVDISKLKSGLYIISVAGKNTTQFIKK